MEALLTLPQLAALGISALIAASTGAFTVLKIAGGLYLFWLVFLPRFILVGRSGAAWLDRLACCIFMLPGLRLIAAR